MHVNITIFVLKQPENMIEAKKDNWKHDRWKFDEKVDQSVESVTRDSSIWKFVFASLFLVWERNEEIYSKTSSNCVLKGTVLMCIVESKILITFWK